MPISIVESWVMPDDVVFHHGDSLLVFAGTWVPPAGPPGLARSSDRGLTWDLILEGEIPAFDEDPFNGDHWVATKLTNSVCRSVLFAESFDNGDTWDTWELPGEITWVKEIAFDLHDPGVIYLVVSPAGSSACGVHRSVDGGHTWAQMNEGFEMPLNHASLYRFPGRPGELLAATDTGLWWWTDQQNVEYLGEDPMKRASLFSVTPCPFRQIVSGTLDVFGPSDVRVGIYSLHGLLVQGLIAGSMGPGTFALLWDGRDQFGKEVCPGTYVLRAQVGRQQYCSRVVRVP
jgi:hypothetical protein